MGEGGGYRIGGPDDVRWIADAVDRLGVTVTVAIPPVFAAYATVVIPGERRRESGDRGQARVRRGSAGGAAAPHPPQPWWLGYLETGVADLVFPDAARTTLHSWPYVLVEAGPDEAAHWRTDEPRTAQRFHHAGEHRWPATRWTPWHSALPELMFPADHAWLVSTLWDDDWTCVGGSAELIADLLREPALVSRAVTTDEDCLPPGHVRD